MRKLIFIFYLLMSMMVLLSTGAKSQSTYFPPLTGNSWDTLSPSSLNWCADSINALYNFLEEEQTKSFILLKDGKIVLEKYFGTYTQDSIMIWFSARKSLTAVLIGIAQQEGSLNINNKTSDYLGSGWTSLQPVKEDSITVWHQLTMTTGLDEDCFDCVTPDSLVYKAAAGTRWAYHNGPYQLLKNVIENAAVSNINFYTNTKVKNKIGMDGFWALVPDSINYHFFSKARDMARFGLLILNRGTWDTTVVLGDTSYYNQMVNPSQNLNASYGYLWWLNGKDSYIDPGSNTLIQGALAPDAPADVISALGGLGQIISISPGNGLVMVRQGLSANSDVVQLPLHNEIWKKIMNLECIATSIDNNNPGNIKLFPNPTNGIVYISGINNNNTDISISIYDFSGREIMFANNQRFINIKGLSKGIYMIMVHYNGKKMIEKLVVN